MGKNRLYTPLLLSFCLLLPVTLWGQASKTRIFGLATGLTQVGAKEYAYSPLGYLGRGPVLSLTYRVIQERKTDFVLAYGMRGILENRFGAAANLQAYGLEHGTLYPLQKNERQELRVGWTHRNYLQILDFADAANYSPRFSIHSSLGGAAEYQIQLPGADGKFRLGLFGQLQLLGVVLQSGYISNAPIGQEADPNAGGAAWFQSMRLFRPGRGWDFSLRPGLAYALSAQTSLSIAYRYDGFVVRGIHRSRQSQGQYLFTLTTQL